MEEDDDFYDTSLLSRRTKPISSQATKRTSSSQATPTKPSRLALNLSLINNRTLPSQRHRDDETMPSPATRPKHTSPKLFGTQLCASQPVKVGPSVKTSNHDTKLKSYPHEQSRPVTESGEGIQSLIVKKRKSTASLPSSQKPKKTKSSTHCPTCGMPSRMLMVFDQHILTCRTVQKKECVAKGNCSSEILREYYHSQLMKQGSPPSAHGSIANNLSPTPAVETTATDILPVPTSTVPAKPATALKTKAAIFKERSEGENVANLPMSSSKENCPKSFETVLKHHLPSVSSVHSLGLPRCEEDFPSVGGIPQASPRREEGSRSPATQFDSPVNLPPPCLEDEETQSLPGSKACVEITEPHESHSLLTGFDPPPIFLPSSPEQGDSPSLLDAYLAPCPPVAPLSLNQITDIPDIFDGRRGPMTTSLLSLNTESPSYEPLSANEGDVAPAKVVECRIPFLEASAAGKTVSDSLLMSFGHCAIVTRGNKNVAMDNPKTVTDSNNGGTSGNHTTVDSDRPIRETDPIEYMDTGPTTTDSFLLYNNTSSIFSQATLRVCSNPSDPEAYSSKVLSSKRKPKSRRKVSKPTCAEKLNCAATIEYAHAGSVGSSPIITSVVPCSCDPPSTSSRPPLQQKQLNATVSVSVSSSDNAAEAGDAPPIKINATCGTGGWDTIGIDASKSVRVGAYRVELSECKRQLSFGCTVEREETEEEEEVSVVMESKFHSTMDGLGLGSSASGRVNKPKKQVQLSILSFVGGRKAADATTSDGPSATAEGGGKALLSPMRLPPAVQDDRISRLLRAQKCKAEWQNLFGLKKPGSIGNGSKSSSESTYSSSDASSIRPIRNCPFYRKISGTSFVVDAFNFGRIPGISAYFLSHFHYDHYIGLRKDFDMPIYCSSVTASLVKLKIGVKSQYIHVVPLHKKTVISGVTVTALDANHCPGSVMFLFQPPNRRNVLHVGDFRATPEMESYPEFWSLSVDKLHLDTTYCDPRYCFPSQSDIIQMVVDYAQKHRNTHGQETLIVCGSYTIGKEKVFERLADELDCKVYAAADKRKILRLLENVSITDRLVDRPLDACVHVVQMSQLRHDLLKRELAKYTPRFSNILAFKPTGWEFKTSSCMNPTTRGKVTIVGISYSEHSSFPELARFVRFIRPKEVVATVNVGKPAQREAMRHHFNAWLRTPAFAPC